MYAPRGGFRHRIDRVRLLSAHPYLDHPRIVFDELAHCLPAQTPDAGEFTNAVVPLKRARVLREVNPVRSAARSNPAKPAQRHCATEPSKRVR